jgi:tetratricopeptide (TPR) repeat protein
MATKAKRTRVQLVETETKKTDVMALGDHVAENPMIYTVATIFVVLCIVVGYTAKQSGSASERTANTEFVRVLNSTDVYAQIDDFAAIAADQSPVQAKALYMQGEAAFLAEDRVVAAKAFEQLREQYPDFEFTPDAVEGLGFIEEDEKDYEAALKHYEDVLANWPDKFAGRRQSYNIGRAHERLDNPRAAVKAYQEQTEFFPGSAVASQAQVALDRLKKSNPELFLEPETDPIPEEISTDDTPESEVILTPPEEPVS